MKIALCDDDLNELQKTKNVIDQFIAKNHSDYQVTLQTYTNGDDLLLHIDNNEKFDLLILDILMPGMNGIDLAKEIRLKNTYCKIIFLTTSPEFALASYKVDAFNYLLKPFSHEEFESLLSKILFTLKKEKSTSIVLKVGGKLIKVQTHNILYIESIKHIMNFHLRNGELLSCYGTMKEYNEILLSEKQFIRCHKSFIVNMDFVMSISSKDFVMVDKTLIPISRQGYPIVKNAYIQNVFEKGNNKL